MKIIFYLWLIDLYSKKNFNLIINAGLKVVKNSLPSEWTWERSQSKIN